MTVFSNKDLNGVWRRRRREELTCISHHPHKLNHSLRTAGQHVQSYGEGPSSTRSTSKQEDSFVLLESRWSTIGRVESGKQVFT